MFALLDIGERAGSGLFNIRTIWQEESWSAPVWEETFTPERLRLSIPIELEEKKIADYMEKNLDNSERVDESTEKDGLYSIRLGEKLGERLGERVGEKVGERVGEKVGEKVTENQQKIIDNIVQNHYITAPELSLAVGISKRKIEINIAKLKAKGLLERIGPDKGGHWRVKNKLDKKQYQYE
jgi:ATP-dependent DNA helicase RecG